MVKKQESGRKGKIGRVRYDEQVTVSTPADFMVAKEKAKMKKSWQYDCFKGVDGVFDQQFSSALTRFYQRFMWDYILIEGCKYYLHESGGEYLNEYIKKKYARY